MARKKTSVLWRRQAGPAVEVGDMTIRPQSRAIGVRTPYGGFVWNRPVSVTIEQDGRVRRMPVIDLTRIVQVVLIGLAVTYWQAGVRARFARRRDTEWQTKHARSD